MFHLYADVLLDLPLKQSYTYIVPEHLSQSIKCGMRVHVDLISREQVGIVERLGPHCDRDDVRPIKALPDTQPLITQEQLDLAYWMADYYLCSPGEALFKMFPKAKRFPKAKQAVDLQPQIQYQLNHEQLPIYQNITAQFGRRKSPTHLLHGITGSGKTEIYIHLLIDALSMGYSSLLLVPEISLTVQLIGRLERVFGDHLALLHSGLKQSDRFRAYIQVLRGEKKIALGTRSAVFAPLKNIGLIIIDEEHDSSFKENSTPRYDARQIALKRKEKHQALLVLGSATPRIETTYHALHSSSAFTYHSLTKRAKGKGLPQVNLIEVTSPQTIISGTLLSELQKNLQSKQQSLLLLNQRGYFPYIYCSHTNTAESCPACAVCLHLHHDGDLRCHYCGYRRQYDGLSSDGSPAILMGSGTQKVEDFLAHRFPNAKIERIDSDAIRQKNVLEDTLGKFFNQEIDILIGTQIIARGLDAPNVSLVGVLQAEKGLHLPDFRSAEKTFSLLTQVAGRAGRGELEGRVFFECMNPQEAIIQSAATQNYQSYYNQEIHMRKATFYPPFSRIVRLLCRGPNQERIHSFMQNFSTLLTKQLEQNINKKDQWQILGPSPAPIEKIHHKFREHIIIKTNSLKKVRTNLANFLAAKKLSLHTEDYLEIDFDPVDLL